MATPPEIPPTASLADVLRIWARRWRWFLAAEVLALALGIAAILLLPTEWEGSSTVQLANLITESNEVQLVEAPPRAVERIRREVFKNEVLRRLGLEDPEQEEAKLFQRTLRARLVPGTDLIELKVRGYSPAQAEQFLKATQEQLRAAHAEIARPRVNRLEAFLLKTRESRSAMEKERARVVDSVAKAGESSAGVAQGLVAGNTIAVRDESLLKLVQRETEIEQQLAWMRGHPTAFLDRSYVSPNPVFPRRGLILAALLAAGAAIAALLVLLADRMPAPPRR